MGGKAGKEIELDKKSVNVKGHLNYFEVFLLKTNKFAFHLSDIDINF
jgi:hypothetical protein